MKKRTTMGDAGNSSADNGPGDNLIQRTSLPAQVQEVLRTEIITGIWAPGVRLPEIALCERFGVSRTPLREALKGLEAEGLLHVFPNRGAIVAEVTISDIEEKMRVLRALEVLAVEIACEAATDEELHAIAELNEGLGETRERSRKLHDMRDFYFGNFSFHAAIVEASHNSTLIEIHRKLHRHLQRVRHMIGLLDGDGIDGIDDHNRIVDALRRRDAKTAAAAMGRHLSLVMERLITKMREKAV